MRREKYVELTEDILRSVEKILSSKGYTHVRIEIPRENYDRSIDVFAWKNMGDRKIHLKITLDTKDLKRQETMDLVGVSTTMESRPIIVSEFDRKVDLQDEVIYEKNSLPAVNTSTLKKLLDESRDLYIIAKKGDFYVRIDGEALRKMREEAGMSLGEVAEILGVTRKSVYEYERSSFDINIDNAYQLIEKFGERITKPFNIFKEELTARKNPSGPPPDNRLEKRILMLLDSENMDYYHAKKTFVDILARRGGKKILITLEHKHGKADILEKSEELSKIKPIGDAVKIIVAPREKLRDAQSICDDAVVITEDELEKLKKTLRQTRDR